jgi:hypothetical protein
MDFAKSATVLPSLGLHPTSILREGLFSYAHCKRTPSHAQLGVFVFLLSR